MPELVEMLRLLTLPMLACLMMGGMLGYCGIHVLKREVIFIDIALAQIAAVGSLIAHFAFEAEENTVLAYVFSLGCVLLTAAFYALVRSSVIQISIEAVIGISYAIAAAAALFLIGRARGHAHVEELLAGSLLWIFWPDVILMLVVFSVIAICFYIFRKPLRSVSESYDHAVVKGVNVVLWDFLFYALVGIVITVTVRIAGVVVVFAFLIIPATISALFSKSWTTRMVIAWTAATVASVAGLVFAHRLDFSVGPPIALFLGCLLAIAALFAKFTRIRPNTTQSSI
jgi:zinc/manganese transport system permease protein